MTGEITLRGQVLPVGGIKEKVLAAHRAGLKTVILPKRNEMDLEDVPEEVRKSLNFIFAETVEDVISHALQDGHRQRTSRQTSTTPSHKRGRHEQSPSS